MAGAASGLLLAVILIAGVSVAGGGSLHLDLAKASSNAAGSGGASIKSGEPGGVAIAPQTTQAASASSGAWPVSSVNGLEGQSGGSVGLLLLPVALGAALGAVFYIAYNRRIDAR